MSNEQVSFPIPETMDSLISTASTYGKLKDLKSKLKELHSYSIILDATSPLCEATLNIKIQRVVNETACKIKETNTKGCHYIAAINDFICTA